MTLGLLAYGEQVRTPISRALLVLPLLVLALFAIWVVLLPFVLWARYRNGKARRRAVGWAIRVNAWLLLVSVPLLVLSAWVTSHWYAGAVMETVEGLLPGVVLGIASLWLTRFERDTSGFHYTPNRWVVLTLTALVAARIIAGFLIGWQRISAGHAAAAALLDAGGLLAIAGVLLGYALAYAWGLRARLPARVPRNS